MPAALLSSGSVWLSRAKAAGVTTERAAPLSINPATKSSMRVAAEARASERPPKASPPAIARPLGARSMRKPAKRFPARLVSEYAETAMATQPRSDVSWRA
ncbi:hypothetical protein D3C72_2051060 [compost metagenome]